MNFVERLFHLAPDGGDGSLELSLIAAAAIGLAAFIVRRARQRLRTQLA